MDHWARSHQLYSRFGLADGLVMRRNGHKAPTPELNRHETVPENGHAHCKRQPHLHSAQPKRKNGALETKLQRQLHDARTDG
jgi:hypothetical protein